MNDARTRLNELIGSIKNEIHLIKTVRDNCYYDDKGPEFADHEWFMPCIDIIEKGARAGDPGLLYLAAENNSYAVSLSFELTEKGDLLFPTLPAAQLYLLSANAGSPHAMLWCAYCFSEGIHGFERDPEKSEAFLQKYLKAEDKPQTLLLTELQFLKDEEKNLEALIGEAEYTESMVDPYTYDKNLDVLPNPSEYALKERADDFAEFCMSLGVLFEEPDESCLPYYDHKHAGQIYEIKKEWLNWCLAQGLELSLE